MVTLREIAAAAGVSAMTVSRVLTGKNKESAPASAARARLIREIAARMKYHPNTAARTIATGRFGSAALLMSSSTPQSSYVPVGLLRGIMGRLAECEMHLTLAQLPDEKLTDSQHVPKVLREWAADGLLIDYTDHIPDQMISLIKAHNVPSIWINSKMSVDCVRPDDYDAGVRATEHLLSLGHRRIVYVDFAHGIESYATAHYSAADRYGGYEQAMLRAGLEPRLVRNENPGPVKTETAMALMSGPDRPTAILCYGGEFDILTMAASAAGLRIPQQISLMRFSAQIFSTVPTAMKAPDEAIGRTAVDMLLDKINDPSRAIPARALAFSLLPGTTAAPPG